MPDQYYRPLSGSSPRRVLDIYPVITDSILSVQYGWVHTAACSLRVPLATILGVAARSNTIKYAHNAHIPNTGEDIVVDRLRQVTYNTCT